MSDIAHVMKSTVAPLLPPVLRSRGQAEMLCAILSNPQREWTLAELAKVSRQSLPTVQREVGRYVATAASSLVHGQLVLRAIADFRQMILTF